MNFNKTDIDGLILIDPIIYKDSRGFFFESFNKKLFDKNNEIKFVQDNESISFKGVIRGLHFQKPPFAQSKLIRCVSGKILDISVDIRKNSKTFGKFFSIELSSQNKKLLFIPKGFAHGFQVLSEMAIVNYKVDNYYNKESESGLIWNDKDLSICWDKNLDPILSKRDLKLNAFKNLNSPF